MTRAETWVQRYGVQIAPGVDGDPLTSAHIRDLGSLRSFVAKGANQFLGGAPYVQRTTADGRVWRRYLVRDWEQWS